MMRLIPALGLMLLLAACGGSNDLNRKPVDLGNFHMVHNVVVAPKLQKGPASREMDKDVIVAAVKNAVDARFRRYPYDENKTRLYHLGVVVEGYVLAQPGVPLVFSPKSAMVVRVMVYRNNPYEKLNEEAEMISVTEDLSGETMLGSGLTQSPEEQLANLSANVAKQIENWLVKMKREKGWFEDGPLPLEQRVAAQPDAAE